MSRMFLLLMSLPTNDSHIHQGLLIKVARSTGINVYNEEKGGITSDSLSGNKTTNHGGVYVSGVSSQHEIPTDYLLSAVQIQTQVFTHAEGPDEYGVYPLFVRYMCSHSVVQSLIDGTSKTRHCNCKRPNPSTPAAKSSKSHQFRCLSRTNIIQYPRYTFLWGYM